MKMKYFLGSLLSIMISISALGQNQGADLISLGELKMARDYFMKRMRQAPAESNYYLGEIAFKEGNLAEAKANYEAGLAADPESALNAVGLAKLQIKTNFKETEKQLKDIQKKNKKDVNVILAIAGAYLDNGMKEKAQEIVKDAYKADKKNPYPYMFEASILEKENKVGEAAQLYDQAIYFDPNCAIAYMKGARVYESINKELAIEKLKQVIALQPDNKLALSELASFYQREGKYTEAIKIYKSYVKDGDYGVEDLRRYAAAEYFTKNYDESVRLLKEGLEKTPNDFVLNRLLMYNYNDNKDYEAGAAAGAKFFSLPLSKGDSILKSDYDNYAKILIELGDKKGAAEQYRKEVALSPTDKDLYKSIVEVCANYKMYPEAAEFYEKYIELHADSADAQNYFQLGRYYLMGGAAAARDTVTMSAEEAKAKSIELYKKADEQFAVVAERVPDSHLGYYNRAQTNYSMDPESEAGLAKPHYEKTIEVILAKGNLEESDKKILVEAYSYLSYYFYLQFDKSGKAADKAEVKTYAGKVLELDPENANGKALFEFAAN